MLDEKEMALRAAVKAIEFQLDKSVLRTSYYRFCCADEQTIGIVKAKEVIEGMIAEYEKMREG